MRNSCLHPPTPTPAPDISSPSKSAMRIHHWDGPVPAQRAGEGYSGFVGGPSLPLLYLEGSCLSSTGLRRGNRYSSYSAEGEIKAEKDLQANGGGRTGWVSHHPNQGIRHEAATVPDLSKAGLGWRDDLGCLT